MHGRLLSRKDNSLTHYIVYNLKPSLINPVVILSSLKLKKQTQNLVEYVLVICSSYKKTHVPAFWKCTLSLITMCYLSTVLPDNDRHI